MSTIDPRKEAKAQLKAAKAYAKAQRPWYKKKRLWFLVVPVAIFAIAFIPYFTSPTAKIGRTCLSVRVASDAQHIGVLSDWINGAATNADLSASLQATATELENAASSQDAPAELATVMRDGAQKLKRARVSLSQPDRTETNRLLNDGLGDVIKAQTYCRAQGLF